MLQIAKKNIFEYVERTKTSALYEKKKKKTDFFFNKKKKKKKLIFLLIEKTKVNYLLQMKCYGSMTTCYFDFKI